MHRTPLRAAPRPAAALLPLLLLTLPCAAQDAPAPLAPGADAPDFVAVDLAGRDVRLADLHGKVVVLDFWATWCAPCLQSLPHVQEIAHAEKPNDVVVLAVCTSDTRARFEAWVREHRNDYPDVVFACDPHERGSDTFDQRASSKLYGVAGLPTKFVIGRDGKVALTIVGHEDGDRRLEAGLARAGVAIDAAVATQGEEQVATAARQATARAAEAAARKRPLFFPEFGVLKARAPLTDIAVVGADGSAFTLAELRGEAFVMVLSWDATAPRPELTRIGSKYASYGVRTLSIMVSTPREAFDAWLRANDGPREFLSCWDPAGTFSPAGGTPTNEERMVFHLSTVLGKIFGQGMHPALPVMLVADAEGRFVGGTQFHPRWADALGNLLLYCGVELKPGDMPQVISPPEAFAPAPPRAAEAKVDPIEVGAPAPDFTMQDLEGAPVRLADYLGKVVVLDFWATWCGPCKAALPHVQELAARYRPQGVVVVASCTSDGRDAFEQWVREHAADYPSIAFAHDAAERTPERASRALYGVSGIPAQFVIDREGKIVAMVSGYREGEVLLDAALAKAGVEVDAAILEKAAEQQSQRNSAKGKTVPAIPMVPMVPIKR